MTTITGPDAEPDVEQSVTASEYIQRQLELEKQAREIMPYSFQTCTYSMGPLRQPVYACTRHSPEGAALCYSCSISCHGDCDLVELFTKRNIQCDCGTTRISGVPCTLRNNITNEIPADTNKYCHNYKGRFCACDRKYDASKEKGTMYQCMLGDACNEDWFHDTCIVGEKYPEVDTEASRDGAPEVGMKVENQGDVVIEEIKNEDSAQDNSAPNCTPHVATNGPTNESSSAAADDEDDDEDDDYRPPGFPTPSSFSAFICWLCITKNPWLRNYSGTPGFLPAVIKTDASEITPTITSQPIHISSTDGPPSKKRKASPDADMPDAPPYPKRPHALEQPMPTSVLTSATDLTTLCTLPPPPNITLPLSLFLTHLVHELPNGPTTFCHCPSHLPLFSRSPLNLLISSIEETTYEPPLSRPSSPAGSHHSILDMGERALSTMDRVKAIEGVMAYNHMKEKLREFLKPFAEGGGVVGAEDVRRYFEKLRGEGIPNGESSGSGRGGGGGSSGDANGNEKGSDGRREQSGY